MTGNPGLIKKLNYHLVLELLRREDVISRAEIAKRTKLSAPTVSRIVDQLMEEGLIREVGLSKAEEVGRKAILLSFNHSIGYVIGVDIGEIKIRTALADIKGQVISYVEKETLAEAGEYATLQKIIDSMREVLSEGKVGDEKLVAISLGAPGIVDVEKGIVLDAPNIKGWKNFPLKALIESHFNKAVGVDNDINLAVMGEQWIGKGKNFRNMVFVSFRTGIGSGIIIDGKLYKGAHGAAGEICFEVVTENPLVRNGDKSHGSLEKIVGGEPLIKEVKDEVRNGAKTEILGLAGGELNRINLETIFSAANKGDQVATQLVRKACRYYGSAIANLVCLIDPQLVIIGGDAIIAGDLVIDEISTIVSELVPFTPEIALSALGTKATVYGAIHEALRTADEVLSLSHPMKKAMLD